MKFIKILNFLALFGTLLNASDDSDCDDKIDGRKSPYGLIPKMKIPRYREVCEREISKLERKLSERKIPKVEPVRLTESLERAEAAKSCLESEDRSSSYICLNSECSLDSQDAALLNKLCRRISSMYSSLASDTSDKNDELNKLGTLCNRLASIRRQHYIPLDQEPTFLLIETDGDDEKDFLRQSGALLELDKFLREQESSNDVQSGKHSPVGQLFKEEALSQKSQNDQHSFSQNPREMKIGSLRIEIPKAISFRFIDEVLKETDLEDKAVKSEAVSSLGVVTCESSGESSSDDDDYSSL